MSLARHMVATALAVGAVLAVAGTARTQLLGTDLSGTWVLNADLSDDPRAVMQQHRGGMRGGDGGPEGAPPEGGRGGGGGFGGPPGGGGGGGFGGPPGGGPPGGGGMDREQMRARMQGMQLPHRLVIVQDDQSITMIAEDRDTLTMVPDGKERIKEAKSGNTRVKARWDHLALEVTTQAPGGHAFTRLYRINDDGRLEIVTRLELPGNGEKVEIVKRYDESQ